MVHFIIAVDIGMSLQETELEIIGTTTIRACLFDEKCQVLSVAKENVSVSITSDELYGVKVEIDPDQLFDQFIRVVKAALNKVPEEGQVSLTFCCQRNSFILWNKSTEIPLTKIICWNDTRSVKSCDEWNKSATIKVLHFGGAFMHFFTRQPRFMAARKLHFLSAMVSHRVIVTVEEVGYGSTKSTELKSLLKNGQLVFGCLDTWLLHRLSCGRSLVAEASNCSATGMFDPYIKDYNNTILKLIGFPISILPPLVDSAVSEGIAIVDERHFGREIKVVSVVRRVSERKGVQMADQQASLFGCGAWNRGDIKISLGTGTFVDMNTADEPHASMNGLYPLVGWRTDGKDIFVAEGNDNNTATLLQWAQNIGLFDSVEATSETAIEAGDTHGVVFIPAFNGLQTPINDVSACSGFLGLKPDTTKAHMVRAILQSIAFRVNQIVETMKDEINIKEIPRIRICGGVSSNEFVCQTITDLLGIPIERVADASNSGCRGTALLAGIELGIWKYEEIANLIGVEKIFTPSPASAQLKRTYSLWLKALERCRRFYER